MFALGYHEALSSATFGLDRDDLLMLLLIVVTFLVVHRALTYLVARLGNVDE